MARRTETSATISILTFLMFRDQLLITCRLDTARISARECIWRGWRCALFCVLFARKSRWSKWERGRSARTTFSAAGRPWRRDLSLG